MARSFEAQVNSWTRKTESRTEAVFKQSAQDVFSEAQTPVAQGGNMPVDTGFLRSSLTSGLNGVPSSQGADSYVFTILGAKLGDSVIGVWTANYAIHVHYGVQGRAGRLWIDKAAQNWQSIVDKNAKEAEARNS